MRPSSVCQISWWQLPHQSVPQSWPKADQSQPPPSYALVHPLSLNIKEKVLLVPSPLMCTSAFNNFIDLKKVIAESWIYKWLEWIHKLVCFLAHDRMSVASLCNPDLSVVVVVVVIVVVVVCEHSCWPHAWPNKVQTLHAHAAISCIVAYQKLYHSDLYLLYSSHICMFILMSIVHKVINIATSNLTKTCI